MEHTRKSTTDGVGPGAAAASNESVGKRPLVQMVPMEDGDTPAAELVADHPGQRDRALAVLKSCPPGSVGAAIEPLLSQAMGWVGNVAAGKVGRFYESQRALLSSAATDENIDKFTHLETEFFKSQSTVPRLAGGLFSAEYRASLVKKSRDSQKHGH